ncbi:hypothetical protein I7I48_05018 [Histoplasma ohiense]|nr:hypothetical protein I7I48_05018 [Histoplasma ohiense (nom. inval.)]
MVILVAWPSGTPMEAPSSFGRISCYSLGDGKLHQGHSGRYHRPASGGKGHGVLYPQFHGTFCKCS